MIRLVTGRGCPHPDTAADRRDEPPRGCAPSVLVDRPATLRCARPDGPKQVRAAVSAIAAGTRRPSAGPGPRSPEVMGRAAEEPRAQPSSNLHDDRAWTPPPCLDWAGPFNGKVTVKVAPRPGPGLLALTCPSWASTRALTIARPIPDPPWPR